MNRNRYRKTLRTATIASLCILGVSCVVLAVAISSPSQQDRPKRDRGQLLPVRPAKNQTKLPPHGDGDREQPRANSFLEREIKRTISDNEDDPDSIEWVELGALPGNWFYTGGLKGEYFNDVSRVRYRAKNRFGAKELKVVAVLRRNGTIHRVVPFPSSDLMNVEAMNRLSEQQMRGLELLSKSLGSYPHEQAKIPDQENEGIGGLEKK